MLVCFGFQDCVGAIDGTLIHAVVADDVGKPFRDRHGDKSWNVMAVCSLNMLFTHINVGYEGSAHDTAVWRRSLGDAAMGFPHPPPGTKSLTLRFIKLDCINYS